MSTLIRTYSDLRQLTTLEDRFNYLRIGGIIGESTFGFNRYLNQAFYSSYEWRQFRKKIIARDEGFDMGLNGYDIGGPIVIHHMNPLLEQDLLDKDPYILMNPEFVICVSEQTHRAIHFSDESMLPKGLIERKPGDTLLWKS